MKECLIPYLTRSHLILHYHEVGVYAEDGCARSEHDDQPEVELGFWPVVFPACLEHLDDRGSCHGRRCGRRRRGEERVGSMVRFVLLRGMLRYSDETGCLTSTQAALIGVAAKSWRQLGEGKGATYDEERKKVEGPWLFRCHNHSKVSWLVKSGSGGWEGAKP